MRVAQYEEHASPPEEPHPERAAAGSEAAATESGLPPLPEAGEAIPDDVRKSPWWKALLCLSFAWCAFLTYWTVRTGMHDLGWAFAGALWTALISWVAFIIIAGGHVPPKLSP